MATKEKRNKYPAIPKNISDFLTEDQKLALNNLRQFGTDIQFIRRPAFQEPVIVLAHASGQILGILDRYGNLNDSPSLMVRNENPDNNRSQ